MGGMVYLFHVLFLNPPGDGQKRITVGPGFRVDGGDESDHKSEVAFSEHFLENLRTARPKTVLEAIQIFQRTMKEKSNDRGRPR